MSAIIIILSDPSSLYPISTPQAVAHGGSWGCCPGGGPQASSAIIVCHHHLPSSSVIVILSSLSSLHPVSTPQAVAHGSSWGCCPGGGPQVSSAIIVISSSPSSLHPVSTPRAVAHGSGWGCCCGGCHCHPEKNKKILHSHLQQGRGLLSSLSHRKEQENPPLTFL